MQEYIARVIASNCLLVCEYDCDPYYYMFFPDFSLILYIIFLRLALKLGSKSTFFPYISFPPLLLASR